MSIIFYLLCYLIVVIDDKQAIVLDPGDAHWGVTCMKARINDRFEKLEKAYKDFVIIQNQGQPNSITLAKGEYLKQLTQLLNRNELIECMAHGACRTGFFSFNQTVIANYLELSSTQVNAIDKSIKQFRSHVEDMIDAEQNIQPSQIDNIAKRLIAEKLPILIKTIADNVPIDAKNKISLLTPHFDMDAIIKQEVTKKVHEAISTRRALESIRKQPANIWHYFTGNLLVISDIDEYQHLLNLSDAQLLQIKQLHSNYTKLVDGFQQSYLDELQRAKKDPTTFFSEIAIKLNRESGAAFAKILTEKQMERQLQVKMQIYGAMIINHHEVAPKLKLTEDQQASFLRYLVNLRKANAELFNQWKNQPDGSFLTNKFITDSVMKKYP